jgi:GDP-L-fucose synthase
LDSRKKEDYPNSLRYNPVVKIVVAGAKGMVGSAIASEIHQSGADVVQLSRNEVDLENEEATLAFISELRPQVIIDAAAKVGGVHANDQFPVDFFRENIRIQNNLMNAAHLVGVERFIFLGSSCIYPRNTSQPIKEEYLFSGPLESTNSAYAMAKLAGIELIKSYRKQFGHRWISLIPASVYGPGDNFNVLQSHVIPALIRKIDSAKKNGINEITLWGDGSALREFLFVSDLAKAINLCIEKYDSDMPLNVGTGQEISIKELSSLISEIIGYQGAILWDSNKPNGTPRKVLDIGRLKDSGWAPNVSLHDGLVKTIGWYRDNLDKGVIRL